MDTSEAIKINQALRDLNVNRLTPPEKTAITLGIEALKRHQYLLENSHYWPVNPLPGETNIPALSPSADRKQRQKISKR